MQDPQRLTVVLAILLGCAVGGHATVSGISSCSGQRSFISCSPLGPHAGYNPAGSMAPRLRGGSNFELDDQCVVDPTHVAGVGIGFKKDKVASRSPSPPFPLPLHVWGWMQISKEHIQHTQHIHRTQHTQNTQPRTAHYLAAGRARDSWNASHGILPAVMWHGQRVSTRLTRCGGCMQVGNHLVVSLAKGWPAALSGQVMEGDILLEIVEAPVAPLSTTALVQTLRGAEGTQVNLLLQRGEQVCACVWGRDG